MAKNNINVIFKFDEEKDLHNIWSACNSDTSFGFDFKKNIDEKTISICKDKKFDECKHELAEKFKKAHSSKLVPIFLKSVNESWKEINDEFFKRLEKIMKRPIYTNSFTGYLTFIGKCPYILKENSFYFNFFSPLVGVLKSTAHEIMHLQFHNTYWKDIEKKIGEDKTKDLKEALTVLLNLEFRDLWFVEDTGYEIHKELRKFIANEWKKEKDFEKLLEMCVEYLKK
jgi:hypothetical protein